MLFRISFCYSELISINPSSILAIRSNAEQSYLSTYPYSLTDFELVSGFVELFTVSTVS